MRSFILLIALISVLSAASFGQASSDVLAAIGGRTITLQDLEPPLAKAWRELPEKIKDTRKSLLEQQIDRRILEKEAESRSVSLDKLIETEVTAKVADPSESEIQKVYDENKAQIGNASLEQVRDEIVRYLKRDAEKKKYDEYISQLKSGHKIAIGKDINSPDIKRSDIVATIDGTNLLYLEYEKRNGLALYELEANVTDAVLASLTQIVDAAVYNSEAESLGIATSTLIAREVTDKMKEYSDIEREQLEKAFRDRLYKKYHVIIFVKEVTPFIQVISADDAPFIGRRNAKVTVVMFSDFQCPACAGVHPVLENVVKEFGSDVRLVVRDFPLEKLHKHAFQAALAANAARKQDKFFEYIDLLYNNQDALDKASLIGYAERLGLDPRRFERDMSDPENAERVRKDIDAGKGYGVHGTPSIFVNGYLVRTLSADSFRKAIRRALER